MDLLKQIALDEKRAERNYAKFEDYTGFKFTECEVFCPFCGVPSGRVKTNGRGAYRCKVCQKVFLLMKEELESE